MGKATAALTAKPLSLAEAPIETLLEWLEAHQVQLVLIEEAQRRLQEALATLDPHSAYLPATSATALAETQADIAARVGCSREMVSRLLKDLERGGYVEAQRGTIVIRRALPARW